jgi:ketopantoate hydroxymethyltransferase
VHLHSTGVCKALSPLLWAVNAEGFSVVSRAAVRVLQQEGKVVSVVGGHVLVEDGIDQMMFVCWWCCVVLCYVGLSPQSAVWMVGSLAITGMMGGGEL